MDGFSTGCEFSYDCPPWHKFKSMRARNDGAIGFRVSGIKRFARVTRFASNPLAGFFWRTISDRKCRTTVTGVPRRMRTPPPVGPCSSPMPRDLWWSQGGGGSYERGSPVPSPRRRLGNGGFTFSSRAENQREMREREKPLSRDMS